MSARRGDDRRREDDLRGGVAGLLAVAVSWGLFWGGWSALIPAVKADLALTDEQLGLALFAVPVAAVPAMLLTGRLAQRLAQHTLPAVTAAFAVGCLLVGLASSRWTFTAALLLVGVASGGIEVALNATLAAREARDGVRLFNKVHAATPLAMVAAAPATGLARAMGASPRAVLTVIAVLVALSAVLAIDPRPWQDAATAPEGAPPGRLSGALLLVGAVGALVLLMENSVEQWGAIHLGQQLAAGPFLASCGPAVYMAGLSVGRILAQWQGPRFDDGTLVRLGGALGGVGLAVAAAGWNVPWTLTGYALAGIGLAPVVPTLLGAVGRAVGPDRRSKVISVVTTVAYAGFLVSPPLVGVLAGRLGLPTALGIVATCGVLVVTGAQAVRLLPALTPTGEES
ncbi:MFS transporter [Kitasatospora atroaurantiaca]|uniref:MFS transporter n=1 Tax=Kitasatospora atroaurantiaca TaxID=285545 RepID=UPI0031DDC7A5